MFEDEFNNINELIKTRKEKGYKEIEIDETDIKIDNYCMSDEVKKKLESLGYNVIKKSKEPESTIYFDYYVISW